MNIVRDGLISVLGLCMMFACVAPIRAANEEMSGSIQDLMTPGEFKAAGLGKLSPEELQKLNAWLQGYRDVTEKAATKKATAVASRTKLDLLVSRVDGTFNGLTGRTIIRLEDGTVWKQANAEDRYRPRVTDHPGGRGHSRHLWLQNASRRDPGILRRSRPAAVGQLALSADFAECAQAVPFSTAKKDSFSVQAIRI